jgi:hypothetical protein
MGPIKERPSGRRVPSLLLSSASKVLSAIRYGNLPAALVLAAAGPITGQKRSDWFGHSLIWNEDPKAGWHLGSWTVP